MSEKNDWNPGLYLQHKNERTQPSIDLVSRIDLENPKKIIDIGCGPGNSTQILFNRWPNSKITGIDNSPAMIEKARTDNPHLEWLIMDATKLELKEKYDLVFSNATIQWLPNHEKLILDFLNILEEKGALAIQMPLFNTMPMSKVIDKVSKRQQWQKQMAGCDKLFTYHSGSFYYDLLANKVKSFELWYTSYVHIMNSHEAIFNMIKSTGLRPYLDRIEKEEDKVKFENEILTEIKTAYPPQKDDKVFFPFERLFFIAYI